MSLRRVQSLVVLVLCLALCGGRDVSSFSNGDIIEQKRIEVAFNVDFEAKIIHGKMKIYFEPKQIGDIIILDTKQLVIHSIIDSQTGETVEFKLDEEHALTNLGVPLKIYYSYDPDDGITHSLVINYSTTVQSPSVQWLAPSMTSGKIHPFMFTQCESIACRSLLPCQDTPSRKVLFSASVTVKKPLVALNAGIFQSKIETDTHTTFFYALKIPIPTYLIALAAGAIESRKISDRSTIYGELAVVDIAAKEFSETEQFILLAEAYTTPYEWGQMNVLVLPPSFPYGGMENPTLTFATPSILAGDKSLANVIAHEIAHSWAGNLVTNADWSNFWLNEGFTVFLERKILEKKYGADGKDFAKLASMIGVSDWIADVKNYGEAHSFTTLNPFLLGKNPDDAVSSVPYERGYNFIYYLESLLIKAMPSQDLFQRFIKSYFEKFKYQSIQYEQFKDYFIEQVSFHLQEKAPEVLNAINWDDWVNTRGYPATKNNFENKYSIEVTAKVNAFFGGSLDATFVDVFKKWHTNLKLFFLFHIMEDKKGSKLTDNQFKLLFETLNLKEGYNSEVTFSFLMLALANGKLNVIKPQLHTFLGKYGRMKFIRPLFQSYARVSKPEAVDLFKELKSTYHPIAVRLIEADLKKI